MEQYCQGTEMEEFNGSTYRTGTGENVRDTGGDWEGPATATLPTLETGNSSLWGSKREVLEKDVAHPCQVLLSCQLRTELGGSMDAICPLSMSVPQNPAWREEKHGDWEKSWRLWVKAVEGVGRVWKGSWGKKRVSVSLFASEFRGTQYFHKGSEAGQS